MGACSESWGKLWYIEYFLMCLDLAGRHVAFVVLSVGSIQRSCFVYGNNNVMHHGRYGAFMLLLEIVLPPVCQA